MDNEVVTMVNIVRRCISDDDGAIVTTEPAPIVSTGAGVSHGTVTSADGTRIAWSRRGSGPDLVMVHCVAASRSSTPQPTLPDALAEHFTVWTYDRRGTGESGTTPPYAVDREFEDLRAIIGLAEGRPVLGYGFSSGATLLLLAAEAGVPLVGLAPLEPPLMPADPHFDLRAEAQRRIETSLADAHHWFNTEVVGVPAEILEQMPPPTENDLQNTATIVHELTFLPGTSAQRFAGLRTPIVVISSDATDPTMLAGVQELAATIPSASAAIVPGEWHGVDDATLTLTIRDFAAGLR